MEANGNLGEEEQKVTGDEACRRKACGSGVAQRSPPRPPTQGRELCECKTGPREKREAATQTDVTAETRDASVQCDGAVHDAEPELSFLPADASVLLPARGRQPAPANDQQTSSGSYKTICPFCSVLYSNSY